MAKMRGAWMYINNPNRSPRDDLNLTVGGVLIVEQADLPGGLWTVTVRVMDDDTFFDDLVHTDTSFQVNALEVGPRPFFLGVIVPRSKLRSSEPSSEHTAEIYCRVSARHGSRNTGWANTHTENVKI